uniref:Uncharacterized protein n=1 Tax=Trichogramma kaykai TaxID=54128 RepID=A0ABD2VYE4_9HYME
MGSTIPRYEKRKRESMQIEKGYGAPGLQTFSSKRHELKPRNITYTCIIRRAQRIYNDAAVHRWKIANNPRAHVDDDDDDEEKNMHLKRKRREKLQYHKELGAGLRVSVSTTSVAKNYTSYNRIKPGAYIVKSLSSSTCA